MKLLLTAGARPNFMKLSPIVRELKKHPEIDFEIVHTGQHYDDNMNDIFFRELDIPKPNYNLGVGSGSHGEQTGKIMIDFEKICKYEKPDIVVVIGDVNSTLACALVASKLHIKVAHIEAGLRSYDMTMPEEINRIVADVVSDYLFCSIKEAHGNLIKENYDDKKIFIVGDTMIDNLLYNVQKINDNPYKDKGKYIALTLHRPSNADNKDTLQKILVALYEISLTNKIIFPIHPRTKNKIEEFGYTHLINHKNITILDPLGYIEFLTLMKYSSLIITDSGGLQIEAAALNIPCITLRENTEQIDTIESGHNVLVGCNYVSIIDQTYKRLDPDFKLSPLDDGLRDGKVSERIVNVLLNKGI